MLIDNQCWYCGSEVVVCGVLTEEENEICIVQKIFNDILMTTVNVSNGNVIIVL